MNKIIEELDESELPELGINPDKVCHVIAKARQFDVKEAPADEDSARTRPTTAWSTCWRTSPTIRPIASSWRSSAAWTRRSRSGSWRSPGSAAELYDPKELDEALREARDQHNKRTAEYLTRLPLLGDYLDEALAAFGQNCEAFDTGRM